MKITVPKSAALYGQSLFELFWKIGIIEGDNISKTINNGTITMSGTYELIITEILSILTAQGEVDEYLMAIRADIGLLGEELPDIENPSGTPPVLGLPNRTTLDETGAVEIRTFKNWFGSNSTVWKKDDDTQIYFLTDPVGSSVSQYLKGSQIRALFNCFGGATPSVIDMNLTPRTISQYQSDIQSGWTRITF